jgi:hypothetical protein
MGFRGIALLLGLEEQCTMADRKQFQNVTEPDPELLRLLEVARGKAITEEELQEQRVSFAFGNAPDSALITKDSVRLASKNIRLMR